MYSALTYDPLTTKRGYGKGRPAANLTGRRFGSLTAIEIVGKNQKGELFWKCLCDCGREHVTRTTKLLAGSVIRCSQCPKTRLVAVPGEVCNRLTVLSQLPSESSHSMWLCRCECGKEVARRAESVRSGNTSSCGCATRLYKRTGRPRTYQNGEAVFHHVLNSYKTRAKKKGWPFELTEEEFYDITQSNCFYCGEEPVQRAQHMADFGTFFGNGVDRIDSSRGYSLDNVVPCCTRCNRGKLDCTLDEFKGWIASVYKHMGLQ